MPAAAAQCVASTAWSMVTSVAAIRPGETVLVPSASGGVAGAAVQAAVIVGARVIASVGAPEKADAVRKLGADVAFCYLETPVAEAVAEATGGRGVDAVVDTTAGPASPITWRRWRPMGGSSRAARTPGRSSRSTSSSSSAAGTGSSGSGWRRPTRSATALEMALAGRISVPVDRTFRFAEAAQAHAYMAERRHVGKIVLVR